MNNCKIPQILIDFKEFQDKKEEIFRNLYIFYRKIFDDFRILFKNIKSEKLQNLEICKNISMLKSLMFKKDTVL